MARKGKSKIRVEDLAPGIAAGYTEGLSAKEALELHPVMGRPGVETIRHMTEEAPQRGAIRPHFVAENAKTGFVRQLGDRRMADAKLLFTPDQIRLLKGGMICLKCLEPQETPFEDVHLPGCEGVLVRGPRYMRDWQIIDLALEMEGDVHIGPSKPMQEMLDEQHVRLDKREFVRKILEGGQGKIPKAWLRDAELLEGLSTDQIKALGRHI